MLAGLLAGVLGFGFAKIVGEPQIVRAIAFEDSHAEHAAGNGGHDQPEAAPVSRTVQSTIGLFTGTTVAGVALGGLFALVYAYAGGRIGPRTPRALALSVAGTAFVAVYLMPFFKYPPNPPSVGNPDTIGRRTVLYLTMIAVSVVAACLAIGLRRRLLERCGEWNASLLAVALFVAVNVLAWVVLPRVSEVPAGFPADVLWRFRMASLGLQVVLWSTIGLVFGALTERSQLNTIAGVGEQTPTFTS